MTLKSLVLASATAMGMIGASAASEGCLFCGDDCSPTVSATRTFTSDAPTLDGGRVSFCRNHKCLDGSLTTQGSAPGNALCHFDVNTGSSCDITQQPDGTFKAVLAFVPAEGEDLEDGDYYSFDVSSPSDPSQSLVHVQGEAVYKGGGTCDCQAAEL